MSEVSVSFDFLFSDITPAELSILALPFTHKCLDLSRYQRIYNDSFPRPLHCHAIALPKGGRHEVEPLLQHAIQTHARRTREAATGRRIDRHLLGLKLMLEELPVDASTYASSSSDSPSSPSPTDPPKNISTLSSLTLFSLAFRSGSSALVTRAPVTNSEALELGGWLWDSLSHSTPPHQILRRVQIIIPAHIHEQVQVAYRRCGPGYAGDLRGWRARVERQNEDGVGTRVHARS